MQVTGIWKLSKDSNTLRDHFTAFAPNGPPSTVDYVYQKRKAGSGFAGLWVSTSEAVNFSLVVRIRPYEGGGLSIISSQGNTRNVKFDGKDYRRVDGYSFELTNRGSNGKVRYTQQMQLSSDLKTLTTTTRVPGRIYPQILVFGRQ